MDIHEILYKEDLTKDDLIALLKISGQDDTELLKKRAYEVMSKHCGESVYLRGLIEFSNYCTFDCYYCGIRRSNKKIERYILDKDEIVETAKWCADKGYGSLVLQSGERSDEEFVDFVSDVVATIKNETKSNALPHGLGITLCVGEQTKETYQRFFDAGAHRYLLRIETSNPELFSKIHPPEQSFSKRLQALKDLKNTGFQVGTGIMLGLPEQTVSHIADDIMFFKSMNIDMIGMGPYIVHKDTPMNHYEPYYRIRKKEIYQLALKTIATTRLYLKNVNIAATTALQAMYGLGREQALMFGANVIMPLLTPQEVREQYTLYEGKPCTDELSSDCFECVVQRIESTGRTVALNEWGDSPHYFERQKSLK
jgi:biotin synthase